LKGSDLDLSEGIISEITWRDWEPVVETSVKFGAGTSRIKKQTA